MRTLVIIGAGFSGIMTAAQLVEQTTTPLEIVIIDKQSSFAKGVAYDTYTRQHILNVAAGNMSAYPDQPNHFCNWVSQLPDYKELNGNHLTKSFMPRAVYGAYLQAIWQQALALAQQKQITISPVYDTVARLAVGEEEVSLALTSGATLSADACVIATGNQRPRNLSIPNIDFYASQYYFQYPWGSEAVSGVLPDLPVLILGNGLTMVDTVIGLRERGFAGTVHALSRHGYEMIPHTDSTLTYSLLAPELTGIDSLPPLVALVNRHLKAARVAGIPATAVIDSLRPHSQQLWQRFSPSDKALFMNRLRHLWGVFRHRIPAQVHAFLQELRHKNELMVIAGKVVDMAETDGCVAVSYLDNASNELVVKHFSRVINCTGPETDLTRMEGHFLHDCLTQGIVCQDFQKLGIRTDTRTYQVLGANGKPNPRLYALGPLLKGELWESVAVPELRGQAAALASELLRAHSHVTDSLSPCHTLA